MSSHGGVQSWKFLNFTLVYLFWYNYQSNKANLDNMGCTWNAGKVKLCETQPIKCISKTFAYLIFKKNWIEKIAKLKSHSIC